MSKVSLKGKVAIITGASKGIGKSISFFLAKEKMRLALVSRSKDLLDEIKNDLPVDNSDVLVIPVDLNDVSSPIIIIKEVIKKFGQIDVLINNAGIAISKKIEDTTIYDWERLININARAPFFLSKEALKYLKKSDLKHIINIGSVVATKGYNNQAAYAASKHALLGFSKVLAREVYKDNIRVSVISPGGVDTDLVTEMRPDIKKSELISPDEIAELIIFLLKQRGNAMIDHINIRRVTKEPWA